MRQLQVFALLTAAAYVLVLPASSVWAAEGGNSALIEHMHDHLSSINEIQLAVIDGDLDEVRGPASWLAIHAPPAGLPADWRPYVKEMQDHAADVAAADSIEKAAMGVADMARTCGECHQHNNLNLEMNELKKPDDEMDDVITHMQRHQWALDRMWMGMILPSDIAWNRGTDMLIDVALHPSEVTPSATQDPQLKIMARRVHQLGSNGILAVTPEARSELYSDMLTTCSSCHTLVRWRPKE